MKLSLIPQERKFFDLFRQQGQLVSEVLSELSKSLLEGRSRHPRLRDLEHKCDDVTHEIYRLTDSTFVTPMDQEDILLLASSLDDIVDLAEEIADKMELYRVKEVPDAARRMGELAAGAGAAIARAVDDLEDMSGLEEQRLEVHRLENEGDKVNREAMAGLFAEENQLSAAEIIKWKDLHDLLEAVLDTCEHVANLLERIAIKNT
jgi:predicted phosphate transport protein (TIGR00153 family)